MYARFRGAMWARCVYDKAMNSNWTNVIITMIKHFFIICDVLEKAMLGRPSARRQVFNLYIQQTQHVLVI